MKTSISLDLSHDNYCVMGHPVAHSQSPNIHKMFAEQTGEQIHYQAIEAPLQGFDQTVQQFKEAGGKGLNITVPFKQQAWELADQRSDLAEKAGAVNTLWFDQAGRICADNTDGKGLVRDIMSNLNQTIRDKNILMLGAGGAVRGVLEPLLRENPTQIVIANRTLSRAEELAGLFAENGHLSASSFEALQGQQFDLIINGTSASLQGKVPPLPDLLLSNHACCYDMMYANTPTAFVRWGIENGAKLSVDGLGMLVEQAAESFQIWRGIRPATPAVMASLRR